MGANCQHSSRGSANYYEHALRRAGLYYECGVLVARQLSGAAGKHGAPEAAWQVSYSPQGYRNSTVRYAPWFSGEFRRRAPKGAPGSSVYGFVPDKF